MGSIWLDMGSYLVRMKRTGSRKLSKCLPDLWDTIKIKKTVKIGKFPEILEIHIFHLFHIFIYPYMIYPMDGNAVKFCRGL